MMPTLEKPKPTPEWLVEKKSKGIWKGRIIVPQGASRRFLKAGEFKLPGHENMLDTYFCIPQKFMQAFDIMKTVDLNPGKWSKHAWTCQLFLGHLADAFPGTVRTVANPIISGPGVVSGDLDHPVFALVCNAATGVPNWAEVIWDTSSPWGRHRWARKTTWVGEAIHRSVGMQLQFQSRISKDLRVSQPLEVDSEVQLSEEHLLVWEAIILRHYFNWKVSNLRWECCEFLRRIIQRD
jgi:hypothetical protein